MQLSVAMCARDGEVLPVFGVTKAGMFSETFGTQVRHHNYVVVHGVSAALWRRKSGLLNSLKWYKE
jgi:hypothetical protein